MKENSINKTLSIDISRIKINELNNNLSSSESFDNSLSYEFISNDFYEKKLLKEKIEEIRMKRLKLPEEIK